MSDRPTANAPVESDRDAAARELRLLIDRLATAGASLEADVD